MSKYLHPWASSDTLLRQIIEYVTIVYTQAACGTFTFLEYTVNSSRDSRPAEGSRPVGSHRSLAAWNQAAG